jgi:hypothetical protein
LGAQECFRAAVAFGGWLTIADAPWRWSGQGWLQDSVEAEVARLRLESYCHFWVA